MPITYSPLRYPGGKSVYAPFLENVLSINNLKNYCLAEAFAGGAGASINLLLKGFVDRIYLNDLDPAIFSIWKNIVEKPREMIEWLHKVPISIDEWKRQKEIYERKKKEVSFELGRATFYLNRCNHSGIIGANPIGGMEQTGVYKISARFNKNTLIRKIFNLSKFNDRICISNLDVIDFISATENVKNIFYYFDPPYYRKSETLYLNHFKHEDHLRLSQNILTLEKPWILSYDNAYEIKKMYSTVPIYKKILSYSAHRKEKHVEYIITKLVVPCNSLN